jgi:hypothetical protein
MAVGEKRFLRRKENNHVSFVNHHLFASPGNYHHRCTKQYAIGFQVFHLEFSDIYYSLDFFSSLIGGSIVAVLALPKLATKSLHGRSMNREIKKLKEENLQLGKKSVGESKKE